MRLDFYIFISSLCVLFMACGASCAYSKREKPKAEKITVREQVQIADIGMQAHKEYVVKEKIDLRGKQVNVPKGVTITFKKGGAIVNGTLNGKGTELNSKTDNVLGVNLKGTWCVDKVSDLLFSKEYLSDTEIINNLNVIQSDAMANEVTINRDYHITIAKSGGAGLLPSNHSTIQLKGTISLENNDYTSYQIVYIKNKEDVTIKGGHIVGDVGKHTYVEGSSSEWGMGIYIMESKDVSLSDIYIARCTGDGIYITGGKEPSIGVYDYASSNVSIQNVTCEANRRQGLSIIHVDGLTVKDCSFIKTGQIEYTAPGAGIDIEPNVSNSRNMSVRNVLVENCKIQENKGTAILANYTYEGNGQQNFENLLFLDCHADGTLLARSTGLTFRRCKFKEVGFASAYSPTHITMEDCTIEGGYGISIYVPSKNGVQSKDRLLALDLINCAISTTVDKALNQSFISCKKWYISNLEYFNVIGCKFAVTATNENKSLKFSEYPFNGKLHMSSSSIDMKGHEFDASGMVLNNNRIRCAKVVRMPQKGNNVVIH